MPEFNNWEKLVAKTEKYMDETFIDNYNNEYIFFGLVHGKDDYFYGFYDPHVSNRLLLLSCVGNFETYDMKVKER